MFKLINLIHEIEYLLTKKRNMNYLKKKKKNWVISILNKN